MPDEAEVAAASALAEGPEDQRSPPPVKRSRELQEQYAKDSEHDGGDAASQAKHARHGPEADRDEVLDADNAKATGAEAAAAQAGHAAAHSPMPIGVPVAVADDDPTGQPDRPLAKPAGPAVPPNKEMEKLLANITPTGQATAPGVAAGTVVQATPVAHTIQQTMPQAGYVLQPSQISPGFAYHTHDLNLDLMSNTFGRRRGARRGPMDEMRQLVRILVKIIPQSFPFLATTEDGGGNRISEEQIKFYLGKTLGEAPHPEWGLPRGWCHYVAGLFQWATGREFTEDQARECAKRLPGRSWEAVETALEKFNLRPHSWKLPLQRGSEAVDGLYILCDENPAPRKPQESEEAHRPRRRTIGLPFLNKVEGFPEMDVWKLIRHMLTIAVGKHGSTPLAMLEQLAVLKREVRDVVDNSINTGMATTGGQQSITAAGTPIGTGQVGGGHQAQLLQTNAAGLVNLQALQQLQQFQAPASRALMVSTGMPANTAEDSGVLRPVALSAAGGHTAFTPVAPQAAPVSTRPSKSHGSQDTVSEHDAEQDAGVEQTVNGQPATMAHKPAEMHHDAMGQPTHVGMLNAANNSNVDETLSTATMGGVVPMSPHQHMQQAQAPQPGAAMHGNFATFPGFNGMSYSHSMLGIKPHGGMMPMQLGVLPTTPIFYGQSAEAQHMQGHLPMQAAQAHQGQLSMLSHQPIIVYGGQVMGHTAQGIPQLMSMPGMGQMQQGLQVQQGNPSNM